MPMPPAKNIQPFMAGSRCAGNQRTLALIPDIKHPDTPNPMRARPSARADTLPAAANSKAPAAATTSNAASVRRGPKRSSSKPSGSWNDAKLRKYTLVSSPSWAGDRSKPATRSGAMTALTVRYRYDRTYANAKGKSTRRTRPGRPAALIGQCDRGGRSG